MLDFCPPELVANARRDFRTFDAGESVTDHQIVFDGRTFLVSVNAIYGDNRAVAAISVILTDLSKLRDMEPAPVSADDESLTAHQRRDGRLNANIQPRLADHSEFGSFSEAEIRPHGRAEQRSSAGGNARESLVWRGSLLGSRIPLSALIQTVAVAECLNFRHAANVLGISQSSVSARVKTLEEDLGIFLFERHARGVRLTEAGRHFVEQVAAGIDQLDHAVKTAGMLARGEHGRLRIGVYSLFSGSFLDDLCRGYREQHPGVAMEIIEGTARNVVMQIRADRLDVAFVAGSPALPDCHSRRLWTEPLVAVLPEKHRLAGRAGVTWPDLANETFLVRYGGPGPQAYDHIVLRMAGHWPAPSIRRSEVEGGTLLSMIAQGQGVTIAGAAASLVPPPGVVFRPILDEPKPIPYSAVWSPHNRSPALRNLLDLAGRMSRSVRTI